MPNGLKNRTTITVIGIVVIVIAIIAVVGVLSLTGYGFWTVIGAGQVGVQDTFGNVDPNVLGSGLHLKAPWTNIVKYDVRTRSIDMTGVSDAKFTRIMERVRDNEHKRTMPPIVDIGAVLYEPGKK